MFFLTCYSPTWHPLAIRGGTIHPKKNLVTNQPLEDFDDWWGRDDIFVLTSLERRHRRDIWQDLLQLTTGSCGQPSSNEKPEVFDTGNFWWISGQHLASYFHLSFFRKHCQKTTWMPLLLCQPLWIPLKMPGILCHKLTISWIQHDWTIHFLGGGFAGGLN